MTHWTKAAARLGNLDDLASSAAWHSLERYMGMSIRRHLSTVVSQLAREGELLRGAFAAAVSPADLLKARRQLLNFRNRYSRVEMTLMFFADAINTRIGAAVLRANLRLWDGTGVNPVAAIKITHHNLLRNTALIHEAGHQAAAVVGWNEELASKLADGLTGAPDGVAGAWASWASEIGADAFAFVHTGYAAVAALHDVLAAEDAVVFRHTSGDPHPISYIRVLLGVEMCRQFYDAGPWDDLAQAWVTLYALAKAPGDTRALLEASLAVLPSIVRITLREPMRAFQGRSLAALINPDRVKPAALLAMEQQLGPALYTSMHWIWTEALRLLALTGFRIATTTGKKEDTFEPPEDWLLRLGGALQAA